MGLTEQEALKNYGTTIKIYTKSYKAIDRAHTDSATHGLLKVICDKRGYILGATIVGARAGDIIHELHLAKTQKIRFHTLHTVIHAYPTYAEIIWHLSKQAYVERLQNNLLVHFAKKIMLFFR
jgi:pyruvate/2-oxoglutarate dehydrogenase complex dihydrolipoamide dehydrogenase (E3) component